MAAVLELADVTVRRGQATLLDARRLDGRGGRALGGARPQRRRQDHPAAGLLGADPPDRRASPGSSARCSAPSTCSSCARGSAGPAPPWPSGSRAHERVRDVVVSASYAVLGRWREQYDELDHDRAAELLAEVGAGAPRRPHLRHPERGRAQAGADRPRADDRPRAAAARRAGRRARPRRPRGPGHHAVGARHRRDARRRRSWSPTTSRRSRRASPTCCCCARAGSSPPGPLAEVLTEETSPRRSGCRCVLGHEDGRYAARAPDDALTARA